ncbi:NADPH-dependent F420 reductase [Micrococcus terreus]|uniref:NADPH-dependent F420 reductase n=3 Tax=Micrococcus terreus TaxID=574650 RepID=UPI003D75A97E
MQTLGIIGSGNIGSAIARLAVAANIRVVVSNSRGPETLTDLVQELGPLASAGTVEDAAAASDTVVLSVPLSASMSIPADLLAGKLVLDTGNYYPFRDGRIRELDAEEFTAGELVQRHFEGARLVKAFSNILAHHIPQLARPADAPDRTALPIASDHEDAKAAAQTLMDQLGFDTVDAGALSEAWRFEPESAAYTQLYLADPSTPMDQMMTAPASPTPASELTSALQNTDRVRVAEREF